jgi:hypothetical protein
LFPTFISSRQPNLAKLFCEWLPLWLHHKILKRNPAPATLQETHPKPNSGRLDVEKLISLLTIDPSPLCTLTWHNMHHDDHHPSGVHHDECGWICSTDYECTNSQHIQVKCGTWLKMVSSARTWNNRCCFQAWRERESTWITLGTQLKISRFLVDKFHYDDYTLKLFPEVENGPSLSPPFAMSMLFFALCCLNDLRVSLSKMSLWTFDNHLQYLKN